MLKFRSLLVFFFSVITMGGAALETTGTGTVQSLTKANFETAIQDPANNGLWLLEFYAPWCGHCKKLAPVLDQVASETVGTMAIGKIDCDQEKALCKEFDIKGFPTLKFSRDGDIQDFPFSRSKQDMVMFATRMSAPAVSQCDTSDDALRVASTQSADGIVFVGYHPAAEGDSHEAKLQSTHLTQVVAQTARIHQAFASFCLLSPTADVTKFGLTEAPHGFVAKLEAGVPATVLEGSDELTTNQVSDFVIENNVPLVATLGPQNFNKIGRNGKPMVIGAVDASDGTQVVTMKKTLRNYALNGPKETVEKYYYGWIDGKRWYKFLSQFNITSLPQVIVLDLPTKEYWQDASYTNVADLMAAVEDGSIETKIAGRPTKGFKGMLYRLEETFFSFYPWSVGVTIAVLVLLVVILLPKPEELRPPYPREEKQPTTTTKPQESDATKGEPKNYDDKNEAGAKVTDAQEESKKDK